MRAVSLLKCLPRRGNFAKGNVGEALKQLNAPVRRPHHEEGTSQHRQKRSLRKRKTSHELRKRRKTKGGGR